MDDRTVQTLRLFQRVATRELGLLQDDYLARRRPFGASRLLWEIGDGPIDVASLRERLGLDPGYASRLLRVLEDEGLVSVERNHADARAKVVVKTSAGAAEVHKLDALADAAASGLLDGLSEHERSELEAAARTVTRVLTRRHLEIAIEPPDTGAAYWCRDRYFAEIDAIFDTGYDPAVSIQATDDDLVMPRGALVMARYHGQPVGCGAVKLPPGQPAHLKRMWVAPTARGLGVAGRILTELERIARDSGATMVRLDTNSALAAATNLYRSRGYVEVPDFNGEPHADLWFERRLA